MCKVTGGKLTIEIDLEHEGHLTQSGKAIEVASTRGFVILDEDPKYAFSCFVTKRLNDKEYKGKNRV